MGSIVKKENISDALSTGRGMHFCYNKRHSSLGWFQVDPYGKSQPMNRTHILLSFLVITLVGLSTSNAENWPQWRGLQQNGISHEQGLPLTWSKTENIAWRVPLPGVAPSTPIVWNKKIFLTSTNRNNEEILLLCIDATGKQLWQRTIGHGGSEQLEKNNLASPTPCTDGKHIWTLTGNGTVACYNFSSSRQWQFQIEDRYGKIDMPWSIASSPTLDGNLLYIQLFHLNSSRVIAVEKNSGVSVRVLLLTDG